MGVRPQVVTWEQLATGIDAKKFPVLLYACGEKYRQTVKQKCDVDTGIAAYLKAGGSLVVLPSKPMPFYLNEETNEPVPSERALPYQTAVEAGKKILENTIAGIHGKPISTITGKPEHTFGEKVSPQMRAKATKEGMPLFGVAGLPGLNLGDKEKD